jgi:hypothetical protein
MARLTDLSPELIALILDFSDWPAYLRLALSCRYLANCSQRIMAHHAKCHARYKASWDVSPATLPALCRALLKDPVAISHVFALEFWGEKRAWRDWEMDGGQLPSALRGVDLQHAGCVFGKYELNALERMMQDKIRLSEEDSKSWRHKIEAGDDGALKGMLVALCPNLKAVRFVKYAAPEREENGAGENQEEKPYR